MHKYIKHIHQTLKRKTSSFKVPLRTAGHQTSHTVKPSPADKQQDHFDVTQILPYLLEGSKQSRPAGTHGWRTEGYTLHPAFGFPSPLFPR